MKNWFYLEKILHHYIILIFLVFTICVQQWVMTIMVDKQ